MRSESESEDQCSHELSKSDEDTPNFHEKSRKSYTRNVLVSLSELDKCKRLPSGLDESIFGELSICSTGLLHSCQDSDSGTLHGYLPLHLHPNRERGLLGSGTSPKLSSCVSGASDPIVKGSCYHLLNRSNVEYRPPYLCKAKVQLRAENEDFRNNETFGSSGDLSQERAEEERRRRDSFEQMRNEQCKTFQEKPSKICGEHKENLDPEIGLLMEASGTYERYINKYNESEECAISRAEASAPAEHAFTAQTSASTFLLPPALESRSLAKSSTGAFISEPCKTKRDHIKGIGLHSSSLEDQYLGEKKPAGGISAGFVKVGFEVCAPQNEVTKKNTNLPSGRNKLVQNLMASTTTSAVDEFSEKLHSWNKQNATPLALPHEYFEQSMLPDLNEHYSTNLRSLKGLSTNHGKGIHPTSTADHGAFQHLPGEKKGLHQTDADTSSKLSRESLDKFSFSEIAGSSKDSQTIESSAIQRDSVGMLTRNALLKSYRFPFPCGRKNYIIPSKVYDSGFIKINCEGIMPSSCTKQTVASKIEENQSIAEDVDSIEGLCLPDEDSLITENDCILPLESTSISAGRLFKANLLTSSSQVDVADMQAALNPFHGDKRTSQLGLEGAVFDSYDMMGSVTPYANLHTQQFFPQFGHCQGNPGIANFNSSYAQQVHMRSSNSKTNLYAPHALQPFPSNVLADHFQYPQPDLRRFGRPTNSPLPQQMPVPNNFPHCQVHGYPRGHTAGVIGHQAAIGNPFQMEVRSRQTHHLSMAGRSSGRISNQMDMGFGMDNN